MYRLCQWRWFGFGFAGWSGRAQGLELLVEHENHLTVGAATGDVPDDDLAGFFGLGRAALGAVLGDDMELRQPRCVWRSGDDQVALHAMRRVLTVVGEFVRVATPGVG